MLEALVEECPEVLSNCSDSMVYLLLFCTDWHWSVLRAGALQAVADGPCSEGLSIWIVSDFTIWKDRVAFWAHWCVEKGPEDQCKNDGCAVAWKNLRDVCQYFDSRVKKIWISDGTKGNNPCVGKGWVCKELWTWFNTWFLDWRRVW